MSIEIEQGTFGRYTVLGCPEDITTGGMGPCTGVIIFDRNSGVIYGAHLPAPHTHDADLLADMLANASDEFAGSSAVEIYISGCCEGMQLEDYDPIQIRAYVEKQVRAAFSGKAKINTCWPDTGTTAVTLILDPATGKFFII